MNKEEKEILIENYLMKALSKCSYFRERYDFRNTKTRTKMLKKLTKELNNIVTRIEELESE